MRGASTVLTIALLLGSTLSSICSAQVIPNGDFESYNITNSGDCHQTTHFGPPSSEKAPIQSCPLNGPSVWYVTHGTPELFNGPQTRNSTAIAIWSGYFSNTFGTNELYGEGFAMDCDFKRGIEYTMAFDAITDRTVDEINVYLVKDGILQGIPISYSDPGYYTIPVVAPSDKQLVFQEQGFNGWSTGIRTFRFSFIPREDFTTLWFYIKDEDERQAFAYFDNIRFEECEGGNIAFPDAEAFASIERAGYIRMYSSFSLTASTDLTVKSGTYIQVDPTASFCTDEIGSVELSIKACALEDGFCFPSDIIPFSSGERSVYSNGTEESNFQYFCQ